MQAERVKGVISMIHYVNSYIISSRGRKGKLMVVAFSIFDLFHVSCNVSYFSILPRHFHSIMNKINSALSTQIDTHAQGRTYESPLSLVSGAFFFPIMPTYLGFPFTTQTKQVMAHVRILQRPKETDYEIRILMQYPKHSLYTTAEGDKKNGTIKRAVQTQSILAIGYNI